MTPATREQILLARGSYNRCQQVPDFLRRFYVKLLASSPEIPPYFVHTKFDQQTKLLQHGILLLLIYARSGNPAMLSRIAARHGPGEINVPKKLYPLFVESFLATVQDCDPECTTEILQAWEASLSPGIAFISGSG